LATITIADNDTPPNLILWGTTGNDTITGGGGDDRIAGVPVTGVLPANLGRGQIDTLTGGSGKDTFLLADSRGNFYDDGSTRTQGLTDYALIKDFNSLDDKLQLRSSSQYLYRHSTRTTEIFLGNGDTFFSSADELIGRLEGVNLTPGAGVWILGNTNRWTTFV
jgi:Ca2+-binding RTX toxin-like protein